MPASLVIAPVASEAPTIFEPSCCMIRAAHEPTLPKPWTAKVVSPGARPIWGAASRNMKTQPRPVACSRPSDPSRATGLPVTIPGVWPWSLPYSSIIQAITWASVLTSGAGMSRVGPSTFSILSMNERAIAWTSSRSSSSAGQLTPPLAPPNGTFATAVFQVISEARARTSSTSTSGWKRMPPL